MSCWQSSNHNISVKLSLSGKATAKLQTYLNNWHLDLNFLITITKTKCSHTSEAATPHSLFCMFWGHLISILHLVQEELRLPLRKLEWDCLQLEGEVWNLTHSSSFESTTLLSILVFFTMSISISNSQRYQVLGPVRWKQNNSPHIAPFKYLCRRAPCISVQQVSVKDKNYRRSGNLISTVLVGKSTSLLATSFWRIKEK